MKTFAFIMASLMMGLSLVPCADEVFTRQEWKIKSETSEQHNKQGHQEHNDACSPFCHCSCCAGASVNHSFAKESPRLLIDLKLYTSYLSGDIIEYSPSIWQPPKIG